MAGSDNPSHCPLNALKRRHPTSATNSSHTNASKDKPPASKTSSGNAAPIDTVHASVSNPKQRKLSAQASQGLYHYAKQLLQNQEMEVEVQQRDLKERQERIREQRNQLERQLRSLQRQINALDDSDSLQDWMDSSDLSLVHAEVPAGLFITVTDALDCDDLSSDSSDSATEEEEKTNGRTPSEDASQAMMGKPKKVIEKERELEEARRDRIKRLKELSSELEGSAKFQRRKKR